MGKKKKPLFPENLYVRFEEEGDDGFYVANRTLEDTMRGIDPIQSEMVGVYKLHSVKKYELKVTEKK